MCPANSDRERERGEREVWGVVERNTVGVRDGMGVRAKYAFDHVFDETVSNEQVYATTAQNIVASSVDGFNGTIFAYGVTSSGKTWTMMGGPTDPGVVMRAVNDVFAAIERTPDRDFLLRVAMLEIYNEAVNDLLDSSRTNLKLREDPRSGFYAEGLTELTLISAQHALSIIAAGDAHRKTSATALNDGSSRSHTILKLSIESSVRPGEDADQQAPVSRTRSVLHLIDLAGSESARAAITKGHTKEGSYINRSLLALGTVIAKLAEGNAAHIPYRDSRLTRLLQGSMTGSGARIAVVCTVTPASSQAEETHNTIKFATRAKKVEIRAERNEFSDQSSLIARYQVEVAALRAHLDALRRDAAGGPAIHDPMHPEVRNLRERLEEERQAVMAREADKAALEGRLARLTRLLLNSSRALADGGRTPMTACLLRSHSAHPEEVPHSPLARERGPASAKDDGLVSHPFIPSPSSAGGYPPELAEHPEPASRIATPEKRGFRLVNLKLAAPYSSEVEGLRQRVGYLAEEVADREEQIAALQRIAKRLSAAAAQSSEARDAAAAASSLHSDIDLQIMMAEREFMETQLQAALEQQVELTATVELLRRQACEAAAAAAPPLRSASCDSDLFASLAAEAGRVAAELDTGDSVPASPSGEEGRVEAARRAVEEEAMAKLEAMEGQVQAALAELQKKEAMLSAERKKLERVKVCTQTSLGQGRDTSFGRQELEVGIGAKLREVTAENAAQSAELARLETQANQLQGYGLDSMSHEELSELILTLTQAVERVRITVQLRRLASNPRPGSASRLLPATSGPFGPLEHNTASASADAGQQQQEAMLQAPHTAQQVDLQEQPSTPGPASSPVPSSPMPSEPEVPNGGPTKKRWMQFRKSPFPKMPPKGLNDEQLRSAINGARPVQWP